MITWWGALLGLALAIILILKKLNPVYSLMVGALIGAILGGASLTQAINVIVHGAANVMGTVMRVLAAGMLAGVMMESGAADTLARTIVHKLGDRFAILALALASMIITAVGVFIPVTVIIMAPIALEVGKKLNISKLALLIALSGGGKAGNIISPNANTIAAAHGFGLQLSQVMIADFVPALTTLATTVIVVICIQHLGSQVTSADIKDTENAKRQLPSLGSALVAPTVAIILLLLTPIGAIFHLAWLEKCNLDAMYVLPLAAIIGALAMHQGKHLRSFAATGISKMTDVVLILIGAGAIGATITQSTFPQLLITGIKTMHIPGVLLAPLSGLLMSGAAASTSTGVILATKAFSKAILDFGVAPLAAAAMVHCSAIVIDSLPQGNYFHVTQNAMHMNIKERSKAIIFEALCGTAAMITATIMYGLLHL
ncbi:GntP family permease [Ligilactobacillus sp. LYQ60]|uniref:GntP family permease n=1 Tax=unclassified Ligilactobacillus TaxID=2767920 RepID=UPI0038520A47